MNKNNNESRPIRHGAALVAGGAIGAGMFALPLAGAGAWTAWTVFGLSLICILTISAASILLEVHKRFELGASFHTLVLKSFGPILAWLNNLSIVFIMLILMYAYITAGGRVLQNSVVGVFNVESADHFARYLPSVLFSSVIALFVWLGAGLVSRLSMLLIAMMSVSFLMVMVSLWPQMDMSILTTGDSFSRLDSLWSAIPVFVAAFACGGIVPSLVDYYNGDIGRARRSVVSGALLSLLVYAIWVLGCFALLGQSQLASLNEQGAGLAQLLVALKAVGGKAYIVGLLNWFSHFAVITSFLSIALGLVHFLLDRFSFKHTVRSRLLATLIVFIPPTIASLIAPYGFVTAIAYAGFFVAISFFIIPSLLYVKHYRWSLQATLVLLAGCLVIVLKGWKYLF